jgi:hypothetical protein
VAILDFIFGFIKVLTGIWSDAHWMTRVWLILFGILTIFGAILEFQENQ